MQIIAKISKIMKSTQSDLIFTFIGLSETPNNFAKKRLLVKIKKGC